MTMTTQKLLAYIDGELSPEEMSAVEAAIRQDPTLRREVDVQRMLSRSVHAAFTPVLDEAIPTRLLEAASSRKTAWRLMPLGNVFAFRPLLSGLAAAAAALVVGIAIGSSFYGGRQTAIASGPEGVMARADLARTLDNQLASNQDSRSVQRVGLTFRDAKGHYCRSFSDVGTAGIACHESTGWHVVALAATEQAARPQYQTAAADMPDIIRDAATAMMTGPVLNAEAEKRARDGGWSVK